MAVIESETYSVRDSREARNVLVVDDDQDILECYKLLFECEGYCVETAPNPAEALVKARSKRFKLAILDFTLPGMKGDALATKLLETNRSMRLIFISGYNEAESSVTNRFMGTRFFMKPIEPESLLSAARSVFNDARFPGVVEPILAQVA